MKLPPAYAAILKTKLDAAREAGVASVRMTFAEQPDGKPLTHFLDAESDTYGDDRLEPDAVRFLIQAMLGAEPGGADAVLSEFHHRAGAHSRMTFAEKASQFRHPENYDKLRDLPDGRELWTGQNDWEDGPTWAWIKPKGDTSHRAQPDDFLKIDHAHCPGCRGTLECYYGDKGRGDREACREHALGQVEEWASDAKSRMAFADFNESAHPRAVDGEFAAKSQTAAYDHDRRMNSVQKGDRADVETATGHALRQITKNASDHWVATKDAIHEAFGERDDLAEHFIALRSERIRDDLKRVADALHARKKGAIKGHDRTDRDFARQDVQKAIRNLHESIADAPASAVKAAARGAYFTDADGELVCFSVAWDEGKHPRMDKGTANGGQFVSGAAIAQARTDPAAAAHLRSVVTDPDERAKLDAQLGAKKTTGLSQDGQKGLRDVAETHAHLQKLIEQAKSPVGVGADELKNLAGILNQHTVAELRQLRVAAGIRAGGLKVEQVNKMIDRAVGIHIADHKPVESAGPDAKKPRTPPAPKTLAEKLEKLKADHPEHADALAGVLNPGKGEVQTVKDFDKREDGTPANPVRGAAYNVPHGSLHLAPDELQYKFDGVKGAKGVSNKLADVTVWDKDGLSGGVLGVWRNPADGKDYVVEGHHRHELAGRVGQGDLNVVYIEADTAKRARAIGALSNMRAGNGTSLDAARFLRDSEGTAETLKEAGVSLSGKLTSEAVAMASLSQPVFDQVVRGDLDPAQAAAIGRHLTDPSMQKGLAEKIKDNKWNADQAEVAAGMMARAPKITTTNDGGLFGAFEEEHSTFDQQVEIRAHIAKALSGEARAFGVVSSKQLEAKVGDAGNTFDIESNKKRRAEAESALDTFEQAGRLKMPLTETLNGVIDRHATDLFHAKTKKDKAHALASALDDAKHVLAGTSGLHAEGQPDAADAGRLESGHQGSEQPSEVPAAGLPTAADAGAASPAAVAATEPEPAAEAKPSTAAKQPASPADIESHVLDTFHRLHDDEHSTTGLVPIHKVRDSVRDKFGAEAATHTALDPILKDMRKRKTLGMMSISDRSRAKPEDIENGVRGVGESFHYFEKHDNTPQRGEKTAPTAVAPPAEPAPVAPKAAEDDAAVEARIRGEADDHATQHVARRRTLEGQAKRLDGQRKKAFDAVAGMAEAHDHASTNGPVTERTPEKIAARQSVLDGMKAKANGIRDKHEAAVAELAGMPATEKEARHRHLAEHLPAALPHLFEQGTATSADGSSTYPIAKAKQAAAEDRTLSPADELHARMGALEPAAPKVEPTTPEDEARFGGYDHTDPAQRDAAGRLADANALTGTNLPYLEGATALAEAAFAKSKEPAEDTGKTGKRNGLIDVPATPPEAPALESPAGSATAAPSVEKPAEVLPPQAKPQEEPPAAPAPAPAPTLKKAPIRASMLDFFKPADAMKSGGGIQSQVAENIAAENARREAREANDAARVADLHKTPLADHVATKKGISKGKLGTQQTLDRLAAEAEHRQSVEQHLAATGELSPQNAKDYPDLRQKPKGDDAEGSGGVPKTPKGPTPDIAPAAAKGEDGASPEAKGKAVEYPATDPAKAPEHPPLHSATVAKIQRNGKAEKVVQWPFHSEIGKGVREGTMTADKARDLHAQLTADPDAVKAHLGEQLKASGLRSPEKIKEQANEIYDRALLSLSMGESVSYGLNYGSGAKSMEASKMGAYAKVMAGLTDDHVKAATARVQARLAGVQKTIDAHKKATANPETLEEFQTLARSKGEESMTPAQRATYDDLRAASRRKDSADARAHKAAVSGFEPGAEATGNVGIVEGHHTKHNRPTHTVTVANRLGDDGFKEALSRAKSLGGTYVNARIAKAYGATPGFQFMDKAKAEQFAAVLRGETIDRTADLAETDEQRRQNRADGLTAKGQSAQAAGSEASTQERRENTRKQSEQAASSRAQANQQIAHGKTLETIGDRMRTGDLKHLNGVRSLADVQELDQAANTAQRNRFRAMEKENPSLTYSDYQRHMGEPHHEDDVSHAEFPYPAFHSDDVKRIALDIQHEPGLKLVAKSLLKKAVGDKVIKFDSPDEIEALQAVEKKLRNHPNRDLARLGARVKDNLARMNRLRRADITTTPELRAALREYIPLKTGADKESPIKKAERELRGTNIPGFFPTPKASIDEMLDRADIRPGDKVLEPSAGKGDILDAIGERHPGAEAFGMETHPKLAEIARMKGHKVTQQDFLQTPTSERATEGNRPNKIVMNPPFENGQDAQHVRHAYDLLAPGGKMVAIVSAGGGRGREDFDRWIAGVDGHIEDMDAGSFNTAESFRKTGVRTRMITIDKPE